MNLLGLLLVVLGLPGTWLQVAAALAVTILSDGSYLGWWWVVLFAGLAAVAEVVEALAGQWGARRFGGSRAAGWGALLGGIVGALVGGVPVPILGALVASFIGTFLGAMLGELWARRRVTPELRVGLGALVGRAIGVGAKLFAGIVMLVAALTVTGVQLTAG